MCHKINESRVLTRPCVSSRVTHRVRTPSHPGSRGSHKKYSCTHSTHADLGDRPARSLRALRSALCAPRSALRAPLNNCVHLRECGAAGSCALKFSLGASGAPILVRGSPLQMACVDCSSLHFSTLAHRHEWGGFRSGGRHTSHQPCYAARRSHRPKPAHWQAPGT
jgi:hypothetical protein